MGSKNRKHGKDLGDRPVDASAADTDVMAEAESDQEAAAESTSESTNPPVDELTQAKQEAADWKDKFLRAKAEQQNAARRAANEIEDSIRYANSTLLRSLLDVADDLDRTVGAGQEGQSGAALFDGVKLIQEKVAKLLRDNQVEYIEAQGEEFDPSRHEALMRQPSPDHEPGTVIQQIQRGYAYRERVLRPAKVIVAVAPPEDGSENEPSREDGEK